LAASEADAVGVVEKVPKSEAGLPAASPRSGLFTASVVVVAMSVTEYVPPKPPVSAETEAGAAGSRVGASSPGGDGWNVFRAWLTIAGKRPVPGSVVLVLGAAVVVGWLVVVVAGRVVEVVAEVGAALDAVVAPLVGADVTALVGGAPLVVVLVAEPLLGPPQAAATMASTAVITTRERQ